MKFRIRNSIKVTGSDSDLLGSYREEGDQEVLGELYSRYIHLVYGVCMKYLRNREDANDGVMQIFEKLMIEIPRHNIENFSNWLHVVTKNYCLMQLRSEKSHREKYEEWINDQTVFMENITLLHPLDEDEVPEVLEKALEDCIERLKEHQKSCIRQFYYEDRCYEEIAVNLGLDEKKVKSYLQNGKRNLKLCLEEKNVGKE